MGHFLDATGEEPDAGQRIRVKRVVMDWSGIVAIAGIAVSWGMLTSRADTNQREIERLRAANEVRAVYDVKQASEMATKSDVQRLSDQIQALSVDFRARAGR